MNEDNSFIGQLSPYLLLAGLLFFCVFMIFIWGKASCLMGAEGCNPLSFYDWVKSYWESFPLE